MSTSTSTSTSTPTPSAPVAVRSRLDTDRQELLDLSLRNPLLNYRLRAQGLEFLGESAAQVFRVLVVEGKRLAFLAAPEESGSTSQADLKLQTALPAEALQARLRSIFHASRTSLEEQGVNTLFLVPGMLRWFERDDRERKRPLRAPLLLVPVELERSSARERFRLRASDEDPEVNLSLLAKLRADFGIDLPDPPEADDYRDLDARARARAGDGDGDGSGTEVPEPADRFFDAVAEAVREQAGWEVERGALVLGFFSFGKFLMYRDLDEASWPAEARPSDHPVVQALLHAGFENEPTPAVDDDAPLDGMLGPADLHQVVDADSSQLLAILDVSRGRNLVIQGPPGTGKSQTITNLIASALGEGRTVLFVAEKLAALEVVKRRLDAVGLGDACLELHSRKTRKKAVLDELRRTVSVGRPRLGATDDDLKMLTTARDRLNAYCEAVNLPVGSSGVTPYQAYGALLKLQARQVGPTPLPLPLELPGMTDWTSYDLKRRQELVEELQSRLADVGVPRAHPFWGCQRAVLLPTETDRLRDLVLAARTAVGALRASADRLAGMLRLPPVASRAEVDRLLRAAQRATKAAQLTGADLTSSDWTTRRGEIDELLNAGMMLEELHRSYDDLLLPDAWDETGSRRDSPSEPADASPAGKDDLREVRQALNASGRHWWCHFAPSYRRARRALARLCRAEPPRELDRQLELVDALLSARRQRDIIRRHEVMAARLFQTRWHGERSHWAALSNLSRWACQLHLDVRARRLPPGIIAFLAEAPALESIGPPSSAVKEALAAYLDRLSALVKFLEYDAAVRFGPGSALHDLAFDPLEALLKAWTEQQGNLPALIGFNHLARRCREELLGGVVAIAEAWPEAAQHLVDVFLRRWYEALLEDAFATRPALAGFDGRGHEHAIGTFCALDCRALRHNRARLALEHWQRLPRHEGGGQLAVLRREFEKKTRHLPLRTLLARAGHAVRAIKPVFLMSPLSVASYLAPGSAPFDLVIFDEASQVRPVDALGALLRGRQAVVVGDSRQLPPTSFFDRLTGGGDAEPDDDELAASASAAGDVESILGLFAAMGAPQRMLRWHYRSRHESLIAVSNREFYDDRLVVFPSPDADRRELGLVLRPVAGAVYDRGGTRTNPVEAEALAKAVLAHARTQLARPAEARLTLGVAAFSQAQRQAIEDQLERLLREDPACEPFFAPGGPEPFFVKNLETVQGDERDVIYISIGYGRTAEGDLAMGFGPLNGEGGERRLNVLITRARLRCEVFTSLGAGDIDLNRTRARGVRALKTFLAYAQQRTQGGRLEAAAQAPREGSGAGAVAGEREPMPESDFEQAVAAALGAAGYTVRGRADVGSAQPAFDLALLDPGQPGRYRLALACDGPSYHAARTARDRDRLRPQVLQALGWRLRRVWSTDWARSPEAALKRLIAAVEEPAAGVPIVSDAAPEPDPDPDPVPSNGQSQVDPAPAPASEIAMAPAYQLARLSETLEGQDLGTVPTERLAQWVAEVVAVESPVHIEEVGRRLAEAAGIKRLGNRLQAAIATACEHACHERTIRRQGDFLWQPSMEQPAVRDRSALPGPSRKLDLIAPEEVAQAVEAVVAASFGIEPDALAVAVGRALGFARISDDFRDRVDTVIQAALASGRLAVHGEHLVRAARPG
jgi:hypothetical protein